MNGWLIVNRFLYTDKFSELYDWLIKAAEKAGSKLTLLTNDRFLVNTDSGKVIYPDTGSTMPDYVIFWDKDIRLARSLEADGLRLYNHADAIEAADLDGDQQEKLEHEFEKERGCTICPTLVISR